MAARSLNKVMLIGNLTRDPNLRYTPNSTAVCSFGLATNRSWNSDSGDKEERVEFHNIVAWSKLAEICDQLLNKGAKVYVEGRLQTRDWKTNDGQERRTTEIVIDDMMLLNSTGSGSGAGSDDSGSRSDSSSSSSSKPKSKSSSKKKKDDDQANQDDMPITETSDAEDISDDIPF